MPDVTQRVRPGLRPSISAPTDESEDAAPRRRLPGSPRLYILGILIVIMLSSGMATGFDLAVRMNYALILLIIISWVWSRWGSDSISAQVTRPAKEVSVGDRVTESFVLRNKTGLPKSWIEVEDKTDIPDLKIAEVVSLPSLISHRQFDIDFTVQQRGEFNLGPLVIRSSDPFGLFPHEVQQADHQNLVVFPRVSEIPDYAAPSALVTGETARRRHSYVLSPEVSSIRDYDSGDGISRIHWRSTARTGKLMVKTFDQGRSNEMWVIMDQEAEQALGEGAHSTDETAATIVASTINKYLSLQLPVGFSGAGSRTLLSRPDRSASQRLNIIRHIARSKPEGTQPVFSLIAEIERDVSRGSSLVIVTSSPDADWVDAMGALQKRGVYTVAVIMDRQSWDPEDVSESPRARLIAHGVKTYMVRQGMSAAAALAEPEAQTVFHRSQAINEAAG
jgi:uncharacterized protein (DUF58 family)